MFPNLFQVLHINRQGEEIDFLNIAEHSFLGLECNSLILSYSRKLWNIVNPIFTQLKTIPVL